MYVPLGPILSILAGILILAIYLIFIAIARLLNCFASPFSAGNKNFANGTGSAPAD